MELLFTGSKSEGVYPVLHATDGRLYRAHVKGQVTPDEVRIRTYADSDVCLRGVVDDLRGHWRITLDPTDPDMIHPFPKTHEDPGGIVSVPAAVDEPVEVLGGEAIDTSCAQTKIEFKPPNSGVEDKASTAGSRETGEGQRGGSGE